jgi:hypothetical protein
MKACKLTNPLRVSQLTSNGSYSSLELIDKFGIIDTSLQISEGDRLRRIDFGVVL